MWLVWRRWQALVAFAAVGLAWAGVVVLQHGFDPFLEYLKISPHLLDLPVTPGFPAYLLVTPYSLLATLLPVSALPALKWLLSAGLLVAACLLAWMGYKSRLASKQNQLPALFFAVVLPLLATPHTMVYDLLLLAPALVIWYFYSRSRQVLLAAVIAYFAAFILPILGVPFNIALVALAPIGVIAAFWAWRPKDEYQPA